jgi:hypothetical protein
MNLSYRVGDDPAIVEKNRTEFFGSLGLKSSGLAIPLQIHSDSVLKIDSPGEYADCDALITDTTGVALVVTVADCVPILLFDPVQKTIAAVHAGWRGTAKAIVRKAVEKMGTEFNVDPKNLLAYIGPSAGVCCYEVRPDVAVFFKNKVVPYYEEKYFIDLKKENAIQLMDNGVLAGNIEISANCTICDHELFHSHRREGIKAGRMMACICVKP